MERKVKIKGQVYVAERLRLRKWLELSSIQIKIRKATEADELSSLVCSYVSVAYSIPVEELEPLDWIEVATAYTTALTTNEIDYSLPLFKFVEEEDEEPWEYEGRTWYAWAHTFAREFGWKLEYIAEMEVDDAVKLMQEILVREQLEKEFDWMRSENSIVYNPNTKRSEYKPLPRPSWMVAVPKAPKKIKIPKALLPIGNVKRYAKH